MEWIFESGAGIFSILCYVVFLNGICGWIGFEIWCGLKRIWKKNGQYEWLYICLKIVILLFVLPVSWILIRSTSKKIGSQIVYNWYPWVNPKITIVLTGLFLIWLVGAAKILCDFFSEKKWLRQLEQVGSPLSNEERERLGNSQISDIYICVGIYSPMISGLKRKKLYLPAISYDPATMEIILAHEVTHLRHHDLLYKHICVMITIVYWFCPWAKLIFNAYNCWSEEICDIELCMGKQAKWTAKEYYSVIFAEIEKRQASQIKMGASLFEEKNTLEWRIKAMKHYHEMKKKGRYLCGALAFVFIISCSLTVMAVSSCAKTGLDIIYDATLTEIEEPISMYGFSRSKEIHKEPLFPITTTVSGAVCTWMMENGERYQINNIFLNESDRVNMCVKITSGSGPVNMGIVQNDLKRYNSVHEEESSIFEIKEKGIYGFYVENKGKDKVTVEYTYSF